MPLAMRASALRVSVDASAGRRKALGREGRVSEEHPIESELGMLRSVGRRLADSVVDRVGLTKGPLEVTRGGQESCIVEQCSILRDRHGFRDLSVHPVVPGKLDLPQPLLERRGQLGVKPVRCKKPRQGIECHLRHESPRVVWTTPDELGGIGRAGRSRRARIPGVRRRRWARRCIPALRANRCCPASTPLSESADRPDRQV